MREENPQMHAPVYEALEQLNVRNFTNVAFVRMVLLFWTFAKQCKPVHNSLNTLVIYLKPTVQKFMVYPSHAVSFSVLVENSGNFRR